MSRVNFAVEQGYNIDAVNGSILVSQLAGAAAPGGDTGPQDAAPIGSTYQRTDGSFYIKTANAEAAADWDAIPLVLSAGYAAVNGVVAIGDTFEEAIEKLVGNQDDIQTSLGITQGDSSFGTFTGAFLTDNQTAKQLFQEIETGLEEIDQNVNDLITLSGVAENATDLGTFTGVTIADSSTVKAALQSLETAIELVEGGVAITEVNITTLQDLDTILVDDVHAVEWELVAWEEATPANKVFQKVTALHNGTASADATVVDDTVHTKLKVGSNFNLVIQVDLNGAAGAQVMRLRASSSTAGVAVEIRRTSVLSVV